ncbi:MAG TPA: hypothetical protein VGL38_09425 [bacterium]|jgi:hypothetical protein
MTESIVSSPKASIRATNHSLASSIFRVARDLIAMMFWLYVPIKLFVFDIDTFLADRFAPSWLWVLHYKFLLLIGTAALLCVLTKSRHILGWTFYTLFFPLVVIFWKVPAFVYREKSWTLAIALVNMTISLFRSFKFKFVVSCLFVIAFVLILSSDNGIILWPATAAILILLLTTMVHRFVHILKPVNEFGAHVEAFTYLRQHFVSQFKPEDGIQTEAIDTCDKKKVEKWTSNLQMLVLLNRLCLLTAKRLREYHNSGIHIASHVTSAMVLIVMASLAFAAINLGLYKCEHQQFQMTSSGSLYSFFYYSFNGLLFRSIPEITPVGMLSQIVSMVESFLALFLVAIFASFFFAMKVQRSAEDLDRAISRIEADGQFMESFIADEYRLSSVEMAIEQLEKFKASMLKVIGQASKSLESV